MCLILNHLCSHEDRKYDEASIFKHLLHFLQSGAGVEKASVEMSLQSVIVLGCISNSRHMLFWVQSNLLLQIHLFARKLIDSIKSSAVTL